MKHEINDNSGSHPNQLCAIVWEYFLNRDGVSENSNSEALTTHNTRVGWEHSNVS